MWSAVEKENAGREAGRVRANARERKEERERKRKREEKNGKNKMKFWRREKQFPFVSRLIGVDIAKLHVP